MLRVWASPALLSESSVPAIPSNLAMQFRSCAVGTLMLAAACASAPEPVDTMPAPAAAQPVEAEQETPRHLADLPPQAQAILLAAARIERLMIRPEGISLRVGDSYDLDQLVIEATDAQGESITEDIAQFFLSSRVVTLEGNPAAGKQMIRAVAPGQAELYVVTPKVIINPDETFEIADEPRIVEVEVVVSGAPAARLELSAPEGNVYTHTVVAMPLRAYTDAGNLLQGETDAVWSTDRPEVAVVDSAGRLRTLRTGTVTVTATADGATASAPVRVLENPVRSVELSAGETRVRTGDVVPLRAIARDARGREIGDAPTVYAVTSNPAWDPSGAAVYQEGFFVAEASGTYRVVATSGTASADVMIQAVPRDVRARVERVGLGSIPNASTSDLWVFQGTDGRDYAYTGTHGGGQKMFAWDVTEPSHPVVTDSVVVDARVVNDVKVNEDATLAVITREGASDRRNGLVILDISDPAHPEPIAEYDATLTGGVHNTFIVGDLVYAIHDGTLDVHIVDISDPRNPREVGRWGIEQPGKYLHDIWVVDGLAYVSYWDDGVYIVDVGDGRWGGTPTEPALVSNFQYRSRWGREDFGNTHVVFPYTNSDGHSYLFVGDEIFGCEECIGGPRGHIHILNVDDPESPEEVAFYRVPEAGVHNLWADDDKLYAAYYQGGLRVVDIAGELRGDLYAQEREIAWFPTMSSDEGVFERNAPLAWGPQPYKGLIYVSDMNSGLWVLWLEEKSETSDER